MPRAGGDVDGRRELIVGGERVVDIVVRVYGGAEPLGARVAMTSLAFMLELVPEAGLVDVDRKLLVPGAARHLGRGVVNGLGLGRVEQAPAALETRRAALDRREGADQFALDGEPGDGKFSTARWVCARHFAVAGTRTSPIESRSIRNSCWPVCPMRPSLSTCRPSPAPGRSPALEVHRAVRLSLVSEWVLSISRIVPLLDRITIDSVCAPPAR